MLWSITWSFYAVPYLLQGRYLRVFLPLRLCTTLGNKQMKEAGQIFDEFWTNEISPKRFKIKLNLVKKFVPT